MAFAMTSLRCLIPALLGVAGIAQGYDLIHRSNVEDPSILGVQGNADASRCVISDDAALIGFD